VSLAIELIENGLVGKLSKHLHCLEHGFQPDERQRNDFSAGADVGLQIAAVFRRRKRMKRGHPVTFSLVSFVKAVTEND
jgi:hypothetical protein